MPSMFTRLGFTTYRTFVTSSRLLAKPIAANIARKQPRVCKPDFTKCRGAAIYEAQEDPVLGPDEDYPDWLWALADRPKTIDEHLLKPDRDLFKKMRKVRLMMNKRIMKLRSINPDLAKELQYPNDDEVIERIRQYEAERSESSESKEEFIEDLREQAAREIAGKKGSQSVDKFG